eukprot:2778079-Amphidinium_carterae.1
MERKEAFILLHFGPPASGGGRWGPRFEKVQPDGDYTGGQLWVEHPNGTERPPPELWTTPDDENLGGYLYETMHTWVKLPARHCLHGVTP